jgi:hypothetical protein
MSTNDSTTPTELPRNEWTDMIEAVRARNERGTGLSPEQIASGVPITGAPLPAVRSASVGRPTTTPVGPPQQEPLSQEEIDRLDRMALESGLVKGPVTQSIANKLGEDIGPYASLEEAIAAGAPVGAEPEMVAIGARKYREAVPVFETPDRQTAREFLARRAEALPRLPDFSKVQMIDMVNGRVLLDGLEFPVTPAELKHLRTFCVTKAKEQITKSLEAALKALEDTSDAGAST